MWGLLKSTPARVLTQTCVCVYAQFYAHMHIARVRYWMLNSGVCLFVWSTFFYLRAFTQIFAVPRSRLLLPPRVRVTLQDPPEFQRCTHPPLQPRPLLESQEDPVCQVIHVNKDEYTHAPPAGLGIMCLSGQYASVQSSSLSFMSSSWAAWVDRLEIYGAHFYTVHYWDNKPITPPCSSHEFPESFSPRTAVMRGSGFLNSCTHLTRYES